MSDNRDAESAGATPQEILAALLQISPEDAEKVRDEATVKADPADH